jgi:hypothetical protein
MEVMKTRPLPEAKGRGTGYDLPMMKRAVLVLMLALAMRGDEVADSRRLQKEALDAYRAGNATLFLDRIAAASALRPQHPSMLYQLALAQAMNGRNDDALATLERVAAMGMVYAPAKAKELEPLHASPRYAAVVERFARNAAPQGAPRPAFSIRRPGLIAEGLAYDAATGRFFVSSVRKRMILAVDRAGHATEFSSNLRWGVFGMAVDRQRRVLWAATSALPQTEGYLAADKDKAALLKIDLHSGRVLETLTPSDDAPHLFGDVLVAPGGEVFVSDSASPVVLHVAGHRLEPFVRGPFPSMQGLASDGHRLYVSDYTRGLHAVDLRTRDVYALATPPDVSLLGVDGIYLAAPRVLIGTQNGTSPNRIIRIRLTPDGLGVAGVDTLAANNPTLADPTLGVLANGAFYFNANAQWDLWSDDGTAVKDAKFEPLRVLKVRP